MREPPAHERENACSPVRVLEKLSLGTTLEMTGEGVESLEEPLRPGSTRDYTLLTVDKGGDVGGIREDDLGASEQRDRERAGFMLGGC